MSIETVDGSGVAIHVRQPISFGVYDSTGDIGGDSRRFTGHK